MSSPRITVITPSFNQGQYIERCLCSVIDQGYDNVEFIVVDGDSMDETADILALYRDDIDHLIIEPDSGPAEGINKALAIATGEVISIVSADDLLLPGVLCEVGRLMNQPNRPSWLVGNAIQIDDSDDLVCDLPAQLPTSQAAFLMHDSGYLPGSASFFRRELFDNLGRFDELFAYSYHYEFACRLLTADVRPALLPITAAAKRDHDTQLSTLNAIAASKEMIKAARRHGARLGFKERCTLWVNCDLRRRILTLAESEDEPRQKQRHLFEQMFKHPWWLGHPGFRNRIAKSVAASASAGQLRFRRAA